MPDKKSLSQVYRSIPIPDTISFLKKLLAFSGPGYLVAVGYMDPGNWATDLQGGARFGYTLLVIVLLSNLIAILLQHLALKLGIATGQDLAQLCRNNFSKPARTVLWIISEVMITATDLAEVIGSAIALNLLFHIPLAVGIIITGADVLILLMLQNKGFRYLEALVITLIGTITLSFLIEIILSRPEMIPLLHGFIPAAELFTNKDMLYISIGIIGATVMPHNLFLHSSIVQTRNFNLNDAGKKEAIKFASIDSAIALTIAFFVNASILVMATAVFHGTGHTDVSDIDQAYKLLAPLLGTTLASWVFGLALLASGQNSTLTGTLTGQIITEGFLDFKIKPWLRRLITRLLAIVPAMIMVIFFSRYGLGSLLILSQVVLGIALPFAVIPLIFFTSSKKLMGQFKNPLWIILTSSVIAIFLVALNLWLVWKIFV